MRFSTQTLNFKGATIEHRAAEQTNEKKKTVFAPIPPLDNKFLSTKANIDVR